MKGSVENTGNLIHKIATILENAKLIVVFTGAGISADSGIPTFRGKGGIWERIDPEEVATAEAIKRDHAKVWEWHLQMREIIDRVEPSPGHIAIAELERIFGTNKVVVITQNVDNLHQDAGNRNVIELHGNIWRVRCMKCGARYIDRTLDYEILPPTCKKCRGDLRLDVVFFNESLPKDALDKAFDYATKADVMLVIGTSAVVWPAALLPYTAHEHGATIIEFNIEPTAITNFAEYYVPGHASHTLPSVLKYLKYRRREG